MDNKILGVDIGATKIHLGVVEGNKVIQEVQFPTLPDASKEDIIHNLINGIESLGDHDLQGIGIGVPGLVDEKKGIVFDLLNISSWKRVELKKHLEDHFKIQVMITNDANVFALGEKIFGKGKDYRSMVGITMGTGFGTGIIANNKLYSGNLSGAGELGSIPYLDKTIEDYCSGKFFREQYNLSGTTVFKNAEKGDPEALKILDEFGVHLANAIKTILYILSPEAIFLGGSVSRSFKYFEASLYNSLESFPFKKILEMLVIQTAYTNNISILGAAALIISEAENKKDSNKSLSS
ncbi:ROK family protein [Gramella lutea]|uniref:ROK family protein n=1 Tax=Christiangramia lutea TaxID=1607951 RepID=A0A9X2A8C3_9FLAO|nr:ROK family protein [Christiangramia lutea]MCH4822459.1 ROK family protein [Christiangramia lutea]